MSHSPKEFEPNPEVVEKLKTLVAHKTREKVLKEMPVPVRHAPIVSGPKPGRNDPCSCGSGKKYKKCCMLKES